MIRKINHQTLQPEDVKLKTWTGREYYMNDLQRAYKLIPDLVLKDIADFTRAHHPSGTFDPDPYIHARNEGRREVWQRIMNHLHLTDEKLMGLYMDHQVNVVPKDE